MKTILISVLLIGAVSCAQKAVKDEKELLKQYPKCYHISRKIFDECIKRNQSGEEVSAMDIENNGLPK